MFGIGSTELLVILVVALIVLGPKSIPGLAKTLGKVMGEFRRVSTDFQRTMNAEMAQEEHDKRKKEAEEELFGKPQAEAAPQPAAAQSAPPASPQPATAPSTPAPAAEDTPPPTPAATTTVDAIAGVQVAPDSPLAQAVARAEAEAHAEARPAQQAAPSDDMVKKA